MCNCIKDVQDKIQERFYNKYKDQINVVLYEQAAFENATFPMDSGQIKLFAKVEAVYKQGKKTLKPSTNIIFTFCPFCGEKYAND